MSYASGNVHCVQTQNTQIAACATVHVIASRKQLLIEGCSNCLHTFVTLDPNSDTPTANMFLKNRDTSYSDTTHVNIKLTLLPNVLTNSEAFPSTSSSNGTFSQQRVIYSIRVHNESHYSLRAIQHRHTTIKLHCIINVSLSSQQIMKQESH